MATIKPEKATASSNGGSDKLRADAHHCVITPVCTPEEQAEMEKHNKELLQELFGSYTNQEHYLNLNQRPKENSILQLPPEHVWEETATAEEQTPRCNLLRWARNLLWGATTETAAATTLIATDLDENQATHEKKL